VGAQELVELLARDQPFYRSSGGGVTLSGGEPTLQLDFAVELARQCRRSDIGVGLQTAGQFRWAGFEPHWGLFEFIHYDLKVLDAARHRRLVGGNPRTILDNARKLRAAGAPLVFRLPVVPGLTDGEDNLRAVAAFLRELDIGSLSLLPYHRMGEVKGRRLGWPLGPLDVAIGSEAEAGLARAAATLTELGLEIAP